MYINVFSDCMLPANLVICMNSDRITNLFYSPCYTMLKADVHCKNRRVTLTQLGLSQLQLYMHIF